MITTKHGRFGMARDNHFWIICKSERNCFKELHAYAKSHPEKTIWYCNCGTKPGRPIPIPEATFEVYTPEKCDGLIIGWKNYQYGKCDVK